MDNLVLNRTLQDQHAAGAAIAQPFCGPALKPSVPSESVGVLQRVAVLETRLDQLCDVLAKSLNNFDQQIAELRQMLLG